MITRMKRIFSVILAILLLTALCSCKKESSDSGKTIRYHLNSEPKTLDPQIAEDNAGDLIIQGIYEGLARLDENNKAYPGVAERWSSNADATEFTFTLREGAVWSNKEPVTANDFVYAWRRALDPATRSGTCHPMLCIKNAREVNSGQLPPESLGVTAKDSKTLVVTLSYSYENFPDLTALTPFMPCNQKFFEETSGKYGLEYKFVLSNGPFIINGRYAWDHGKSIKLARSDTYQGNQVPVPSGVSFFIGKNEVDVSDPILALTNGSVDVIPLPERLVSQAESSELTIRSFEDSTWGICFNTGDEVMKNLNLRKGFLQTLDREALLSHIPQRSTRADSIIGKAASVRGKSYREQAESKSVLIPFDENARAFFTTGLQELGLGEFPSVTVICPDDESVKLVVNEMLVTWNGQTGNYFNMEPLSEKELNQRVLNGNYQIAVCGIKPGTETELLSVFRSDSELNPALLNSPDFDALLDQAEQSGHDAADYYAQAENYLNQQCVFYPLYYKNTYYAISQGVSGVVFHEGTGVIDFVKTAKE